MWMQLFRTRLQAPKRLPMQVTSLFYLIDAATNDVVEGGKVDQQRPPWLGGLPVVLSASPALDLPGC